MKRAHDKNGMRFVRSLKEKTPKQKKGDLGQGKRGFLERWHETEDSQNPAGQQLNVNQQQIVGILAEGTNKNLVPIGVEDQ